MKNNVNRKYENSTIGRYMINNTPYQNHAIFLDFTWVFVLNFIQPIVTLGGDIGGGNKALNNKYKGYIIWQK